MAIESDDESSISKKAGLLVEPAIRQFRYMFCFTNFVQEFNERKQNLALVLRRLQNDVDVAERNAEEIEKDVNKWLEDANNEIKGVNPLENEKGKNGKCFTWCPNWIRQFKLSKELAKKTETLRNLEENSKKFLKLSHKKNIAESSKEAFKQIMEALKDDNVNMIGLCSMGGMDKTTLVKEVGSRAKALHLFDEVFMATVSQNPNVTDIQNQMADKLGLKIEEKSKEGRAERLWKRLLREKKMLIVLDDVWKVINLKEIGIPFGDDHRGCKILLTTRLENICSDMGCQQKVFSSLLSENEAWSLFKINAGLSDGESTLNIVAKQVARECQGLHIALVTVGRALRGKEAYEWEAASKLLKNSQFPDLGEIDGRTYACLKLSYDYLKPKETKLCFLLCCLFPEDYNIPIEDLTRYAVGYGLHQDVKSIEDARERVYAAIKDLKDSCMLLGTETEEHVKMHDLVRDVAIQIASSEEYGFMVLKKWPRSIESVEGCTTISLLGNKLTKLPEALVCPRLKVLLLELGDNLNVPGSFFKEMTEIEVLSLKGGCLSLQSLELSTNLLSLLLIECQCKGLNLLRKLQRLRILCFIRCYYIETLPEEIGELKELRLLDVTGCKNLKRIPMNLIARLEKLEELLIGKDSFKEWAVWISTGIMNASLQEVNSLSQLAVLSLRIPQVECIPRDFVFPRLHKYDIILGNYYSSTGDPVGYPTSTRLFLGGISATSLNAKTFEQLFPTVSQIVFRRVVGLENIINSLSQFSGQRKGSLQRLEFVDVDGCEDICTLFPAKLLQALKNLRSVNIESCESLEEVFELGKGSKEEKELPLLSSLKTLKLSRLLQLKCIWKGPTRHVSLQNLVHLKLFYLAELTFIFTSSLAQSLPQLETLEVSSCDELKYIIREQDDEKAIIPEFLSFQKLKTLLVSDCEKLEYVIPGSLSPSLVKLKQMTIRYCGKLKYVFPVSVAPSLLNLEQMTIFADNLKQIFYSGEEDALPRDGIVKLPRLREMDLSSKSNSSFFGPKNRAAQLPFLQNLSILGHEELGNLLAQLQGFTSLETLKLESLPDTRMRSIWKSLVLSNLTTLEVNECKRITHVFTYSMIASLVHLKVLKIRLCEELEQIIAKDDDERDQLLSVSHLQSLCFPSLCKIEVRECRKLKNLFPIAMASGLPKLKILRVTKASRLLGVFGQEDINALPVDVEEMVLRNLRELSLEQLPSIISFILGYYDFLFPRLKKLKVYECPKLNTNFDTTPNGSMSARYKISQVAEDSSDDCSVPTNTYRMWTRDDGWEER